MRGEDRRLARQLHRAAVTREPAQYPRGNVRHVGTPRAQVGVPESAQTGRQPRGFRLPGGLRGNAVRSQHPRNSDNQLRVFKK